MRTPRVLSAACLVAAALGPPARPVAASVIALDPPPEGRFVLDRAELLGDAGGSSVQEIAAALLAEHETPIFVVTIRAMADHWPHGEIRIETFAHLLFDQWEIGRAELGGEVWNTGILLVVSRDDRAARIQLGAGWAREKDGECSRIMDGLIVPKFRQGRFGEGIIAGVRALDAMARGKPLPAQAPRGGISKPSSAPARAPPSPGSGATASRRSGGFSWPPVLGCFAVILVIGLGAAAVSAFSRGRDERGPVGGPSEGTVGAGRGRGWGGLGWFLGGLLLGRMTSGGRGRRRRGWDSFGGFGGTGGFGGGGFGGGGFRGGGFGGGGFGGGRGGGYSGGGGATGKW